MRLARIISDGREGIALADGDGARALFDTDAGYPGGLSELVSGGPQALQRGAEALAAAEPVDLESVSFLPLLGQTGKIICVGINYRAHARETHYDVPPHPTVFARFPTSLTGHKAPLVRPRVSAQLDYEGELVAVIGTGGRHIAQGDALRHVIGYSVFNDGSVRDFQMDTPQWTVGKNFDRTGAFGPFLVTADEVPPGGAGLRLTTRLNGQIVQQADTSEMIYDVAGVIAFLSQAMTLDPGDVLVMGTPPGVGLERDPQLFMKAGDVCEVEIDGIGLLSNPILDEAPPSQATRSLRQLMEGMTMSIIEDIQRRSAHIHWPDGIVPEEADLFAHNDIVIAAPAAQVWDHLIHATAWPDWYSNARNVTVNAPSRLLAAGVTFDWITFGAHIHSTVHEFEPTARIGWYGETDQWLAYHTWLLEPRGEATTYVVMEETGTGVSPRKLARSNPGHMHRGHDLWNVSLKFLCGGIPS